MTEIPQPHILLEGVKNLRDVGGYVTRSGQTVRHKVLLRSGNLDKATPESQQSLIDYGLKHVIDVRDEWEQQSYRDVFSDNSIVLYRNFPLLGDTHLKDAESARVMNDAENLAVTCIFLLKNCMPQVTRIMEALATLPENECALVHCAAGKDRTGMVVALVLGALDVPEQKIIEDYALSSFWSSQWREVLQPDPDEGVRRRQMRDASASEETMQAVLAWLNTEYGGVNGYLRAAGCDDTVLNGLRARMLVGDAP